MFFLGPFDGQCPRRKPVTEGNVTIGFNEPRLDCPLPVVTQLARDGATSEAKLKQRLARGFGFARHGRPVAQVERVGGHRLDVGARWWNQPGRLWIAGNRFGGRGYDPPL
jgi:hypothetical protein